MYHINNQVVFSLPSFARGYVEGAPAVFAKANLYDPMSDFRLQVNVKFCQKYLILKQRSFVG